MRNIQWMVIEEFPDGEFNIPIIDDSQAVFDDYGEASEFSSNLQKSYIFPLSSDRNIYGEAYQYSAMKESYKAVISHLSVSMDDFFKRRFGEFSDAKHIIRGKAKDLWGLGPTEIAKIELRIHNEFRPNHATIINSFERWEQIKYYPDPWHKTVLMLIKPYIK